MNSVHREARNSKFDNIVSVLCTPITWALIAEKLGVQQKAPHALTSSSNKRGIISVSGEIKSGISSRFCVDGVEFDVTPNTCVIGNLTLGVLARVKISSLQGKKPSAISVAILNERYAH